MTGRPDVMLFAPSMRGGGAERMIAQLAGAFAARGVGVELVLAQASGPHLDTLDPRVRVTDLAAGRVSSALPRLRGRLADGRPQAVMGTLSHANVVLAVAHRMVRSPARLVLQEVLDVDMMARHPTRRIERMLPALMRLTYGRADLVVANSAGVARSLTARAGIPASRIRTIQNAVDVVGVRERAREPGAWAWPEPDDGSPLVMAMGRLTAQKDFVTLVEAFARLVSQRPARLVLLGVGPEQERIEATIERLGLAGHVAMPGFLPNPYPLLGTASVFVMSSRWEGLPSAMVDALALGVPVVSTDCPSGPAEVLAEGAVGALVPVGDAGALARAIAGTLDAPPAPGRLVARAELYALETVVPLYLDALGLDALGLDALGLDAPSPDVA